MGKIPKAIAAIYKAKNEDGKIRQQDIATVLGCSQSTVSHILSGSRGLSEKWIDAFCDLLDISLGDIEEAKNHPPETKELRKCFARLKLLYETNPVGYGSISRNIDDWLEGTRLARNDEPELEGGTETWTSQTR